MKNILVTRINNIHKQTIETLLQPQPQPSRISATKTASLLPPQLNGF
jgi:hypothetical protein